MSDFISIQGGVPLKGRIPISGAKNAALPLLCASLLTSETIHYSNVPQLADIHLLLALLKQHGVHVHQNGNLIDLTAGQITSYEAPYELVKQMRASILVLGPLLARHKKARVSLPGGCAIGSRPVDLHLDGLSQMGAEINLINGYVEASAPHGLKGCVISMPVVSVTATENLMMAATLAHGETHIIQPAREPEIVDLARLLKKMGAHIEGEGTDRIIIKGVDSLKGATHEVIPDRIEIGTYAIAAAITGGELELFPVFEEHLTSFLSFLTRSGVEISFNGTILKVSSKNVRGVDIVTDPFPGFPTDLQAQWMALMTVASGTSLIKETIFENRFMHVPELVRMGADITVHGCNALVRGVNQLKGAPVMATDLRASVSLILAGLKAEGETTLTRIYHLDRGYENLEKKLTACGALIQRFNGVSNV
jgi:UDP-N-acetylglucosamine 1-carboxyvinyltransferase